MFLFSHCRRQMGGPTSGPGSTPASTPAAPPTLPDIKDIDKLIKDPAALKERMELQMDIMEDASQKSVESVIKDQLGFKDMDTYNDYISKNPHMAQQMTRIVLANATQAFFQEHGDLVKHFKKTLHGPHNTLGEDWDGIKQKINNFGSRIKDRAWGENAQMVVSAFVISQGVKGGAALVNHAMFADNKLSHMAPFMGKWTMEGPAAVAGLQSMGLPAVETMGFGVKSVAKGVETLAQEGVEALNNPLEWYSEFGSHFDSTQNHIQSGEFFKDQRAQAEYFPDSMKGIADKILDHAESNPPKAPSLHGLSHAEIQKAAEYCFAIERVIFDPQKEDDPELKMAEQTRFQKQLLGGVMHEAGATRHIYTASHRLFTGSLLTNPNTRNIFTEAYNNVREDPSKKETQLQLDPATAEKGFRDILNKHEIPKDLNVDRTKIRAEMKNLQGKLKGANKEKILGFIDPSIGLTGNILKGVLALALTAYGSHYALKAVKGAWEKLTKKPDKKLDDGEIKKKELGKLEKAFDTDGNVHKDGLVNLFTILKKERILSPAISVNKDPKKLLENRALTPMNESGKTLCDLSLNGFNTPNNKANLSALRDAIEAGGNAGALRKALWKDLETHHGADAKKFVAKEKQYFEGLKDIESVVNGMEKGKPTKLTITLDKKLPITDGKTLELKIPASGKYFRRKRKIEQFYESLLTSRGSVYNAARRGRTNGLKSVELEGMPLNSKDKKAQFFLFFANDGHMYLGQNNKLRTTGKFRKGARQNEAERYRIESLSGSPIAT